MNVCKFYYRELNPKLSLLLDANRTVNDHILVIGDAAVDHSFLAGVDDYEGKVDDGVGRWWPVCLLLRLSVPLNKVLKGYLLWEITET